MTDPLPPSAYGAGYTSGGPPGQAPGQPTAYVPGAHPYPPPGPTAGQGGGAILSFGGILAILTGVAHAFWPTGLLMFLADSTMKKSDFKNWRMGWVLGYSAAQILFGLLMVAGGVALMRQSRRGRIWIGFSAVFLFLLNWASLLLRLFNYPANIKKDVGYKDIFRYNGVFWWFDRDPRHFKSKKEFLDYYNNAFVIEVVSFSALVMATIGVMIVALRSKVGQNPAFVPAPYRP
jgi:hypothetical protein